MKIDQDLRIIHDNVFKWPMRVYMNTGYFRFLSLSIEIEFAGQLYCTSVGGYGEGAGLYYDVSQHYNRI
jgi:hypothetical protein